jgi:2-methylisocitrate lyase-like PEP mutase family enzyme
VQGEPLLLANAVDIGTAKALAFLSFSALATTSAGHAATLGRHDGGVTRDEAIEHAAAL